MRDGAWWFSVHTRALAQMAAPSLFLYLRLGGHIAHARGIYLCDVMYSI